MPLATAKEGSKENKSSTPAVFFRAAVILALSIVLGFAFNSSNPIGVRWSQNANETSLTDPVVLAQASTVAPQTNGNHLATALSTNAAAVVPAIKPPTDSPPVQAASITTNEPPAVAPNPAPMHWREAKPFVTSGEAVLVDVRPRTMYDAGHIPGAVSLPETSSVEEFNAFQAQYPKDKLLILYCSSTSCSMSQRVAVRMVTQFGYKNVKYMTGGYLEWQQIEQTPQNGEAKP